MIEILEPLRWKDIAANKEPEELPFLHFFEDLSESDEPAEG